MFDVVFALEEEEDAGRSSHAKAVKTPIILTMMIVMPIITSHFIFFVLVVV